MRAFLWYIECARCGHRHLLSATPEGEFDGSVSPIDFFFAIQCPCGALIEQVPSPQQAVPAESYITQEKRELVRKLSKTYGRAN